MPCHHLLPGSLHGAEYVGPDEATDSVIDNPVVRGHQQEVDGLCGQEPGTAQPVCCPELLLQLLQHVRLVLAPTHVGEEAQQEGDGEECLVQHHLDGDNSGTPGHEPGVQPAVPEGHVGGGRHVSPARQLDDLVSV